MGVSEQLGVKRATVAQWEGDRHLPELDKVRRLDEFLGARGELIALAGADREGEDGDAPLVTPLNRSLAEVLQDVADALVDALIPAVGTTPPGWTHNLGRGIPTPLSTAFVIRTLQMCDDARVDLHALGAALQDRESDGGWTNRLAVESRPEVTAVVLAALSRLGLLADVPGSLAKLEAGMGAFSRSRPYVISVVLEATLAIDPAAPLVTDLVRTLLDVRVDDRAGRLWTMDATAPAGRVEPSLAHTARAMTVLRLARTSGVAAGDEVDDAIATATDWIVGLSTPDHGVSETLRPEPDDRAADIPIDHFSAAWCVRALAGADGVPTPRLEAALNTLWHNYSPQDRLWTWRSNGSLPSWMTHDAVAALRVHALSSTTTPITAELPVAPRPDAS